MTGSQVRQKFLDYFAARGHRVVRSSSLVPANDPTLLFTNAGMNQFKDVILGLEKRDYTRATTSQKCVRAGGKHNDLDNVGYTRRHHTFFEMLGNFSFGDYFKRDAIAFAWELIIKEFGLPKDKLYFTVFREDDDAERLWQEVAGVPKDRIFRLDEEDNFWQMGETGPCGPNSEIHYDLGAEAGPGSFPDNPGERFVEIWNLVFMQYDRDSSGTMTPLPMPVIDTGMGLERMAAVLQGKLSNYETDLLLPVIERAAELCRKTYGDDARADTALRINADHARATAFLINDGVLPANDGRGYVLRKIMRRAMRHGKKLGIEAPLLNPLVDAVVAGMSAPYPELLTQAETVKRLVQVEEERFGTTLKQALVVFEQIAEKLPPGGTLPGGEAFRLYDTYGLPPDFTEELARERGLAVDMAGFETELLAQQERARQSSKMGAVTGDPVYLGLLQEGKTKFRGYDSLVVEDARVLAVLTEGRLARRLDRGQEGQIVLDWTPFYAAAGGQVGDHGVIASEGSAAEVTDCTMPVPGLYVHHVKVTAGGFERGMTVRAQVDPNFRAGAMRNHTGTHLLHAALRETLGPHVKQAGSLVAPDRLRFDFSHYTGLSPRELRHIENRVNGEILKGTALLTKVMGREEALAYGALAFFGDKYGERVRVVEVPGFSKEFCGGTHVPQTGEIGLFLLNAEQGISAGTRRVEALTGEAALRRAQEDQGILEELEETAKTDRRSLVDEYARLREQLKAKEREIQGLRLKLATGTGDAARADLQEVGGIQVWTPRFEGLDRKAHAAVVDDFRNRNQGRPFVLLSTSVGDEGVQVITAVSDSLKDRVKAPEIMKRLGLKGGGRPEFAQGGGVAPGEVDSFRKRAGEVLREMLEGVGV